MLRTGATAYCSFGHHLALQGIHLQYGDIAYNYRSGTVGKRQQVAFGRLCPEHVALQEQFGHAGPSARPCPRRWPGSPRRMPRPNTLCHAVSLGGDGGRRDDESLAMTAEWPGHYLGKPLRPIIFWMTSLAARGAYDPRLFGAGSTSSRTSSLCSRALLPLPMRLPGPWAAVAGDHCGSGSRAFRWAPAAGVGLRAQAGWVVPAADPGDRRRPQPRTILVNEGSRSSATTRGWTDVETLIHDHDLRGRADADPLMVNEHILAGCGGDPALWTTPTQCGCCGGPSLGGAAPGPPASHRQARFRPDHLHPAPRRHRFCCSPQRSPWPAAGPSSSSRNGSARPVALTAS